jgi:uncharacterized membrane protein YjjB (DUF3815 family)
MDIQSLSAGAQVDNFWAFDQQMPQFALIAAGSLAVSVVGYLYFKHIARAPRYVAVVAAITPLPSALLGMMGLVAGVYQQHTANIP